MEAGFLLSLSTERQTYYRGQQVATTCACKRSAGSKPTNANVTLRGLWSGAVGTAHNGLSCRIAFGGPQLYQLRSYITRVDFTHLESPLSNVTTS
jgi:hypothetical protein